MSGRVERLFADGLPVRLADIRAIGSAKSPRKGGGSGPKGRKKGKSKRGPGGGRPQPTRADNISNLADRRPARPSEEEAADAGGEPEDWSEQSGGAGRKVKSAPLKLSDVELLELMACFMPMLTAAGLFEGVISTRSERRRVGRKREYSVIDVFVFEFAIWLYGSIRSAEDNLSDPKNWERVREALEFAHPDRPDWRLSPKPMNRDKHYRFRSKYLTDQMLRTIRKLARDAAVNAAKAMGLLDPEGRNSFTYPRLLMVADATFLPAVYTIPHWAVGPGDNKRTDPDAKVFYRNDRYLAGSAGYMLVYVSCRLPFGNERLVLDIDFADPDHPGADDDPGFNPNNDATVATKMFLDLIGDYAHKLARVHGLCYDMALRSADADRLLDAGKLPFTRIPYTAGSGPAEKNLGTHTFTTRDGNKATFKVYAINGTPGIVFPDGNGELWFFPLKRIQTKKVPRAGDKFSIQGTWAIREYSKHTKNGAKRDASQSTDCDHNRETDEIPALFPNLMKFKGAKTTITHNSSRAERKANPHARRTLALRPIPESDPWFTEMYGLREDAESTFSGVKADLLDRRCRTIGKRSVHFNQLAYQFKTIITALVAHHKRTNADISKWFGKYQLPVRLRAGPELKAA
ncbi:hypothetical protein [Candidatus Poriferisocius sp.]|uniref:hypothetical protein n=1 Tax=Candidatus Poriferisocius sp. TaxID=3101276 RepID=UPI003B011EC5